jgi:hypothetical protein
MNSPMANSCRTPAYGLTTPIGPRGIPRGWRRWGFDEDAQCRSKSRVVLRYKGTGRGISFSRDVLRTRSEAFGCPHGSRGGTAGSAARTV